MKSDLVQRTKIVATLGPATSSQAQIDKLAKAGASVFRLNFSHGEHAIHARNIEYIRQVEADLQRPLAIIADLQGPKIRIGTFKDKVVNLVAGQQFALHQAEVIGDLTRVTLPHPDLFVIFSRGDRILLNDGRIVLMVQQCNRNQIDCEVVIGGELSDRKGVNIPGKYLPVAAVTAKDKVDLEFALSHEVDYLAISFVQQPSDILQVKRLVKKRAGIIAKLEKPLAIESLDEIIAIADGIMIARGDLGVEIPLERVPGLQKRITQACRKMGKPVIVATQMLESMIESPIPTRAEASDVATALYDGADAVMLSAETAVGSYAKESVGVMHKMITATEGDPGFWQTIAASQLPADASSNDIIARSAVDIAERSQCVAIVTFTTTGSTAMRASRARPHVPLIALTPVVSSARRMVLLWGVISVVSDDVASVITMEKRAGKIANKHGLGATGDPIVVTAGIPFGTPGITNTIRLTKIG